MLILTNRRSHTSLEFKRRRRRTHPSLGRWRRLTHRQSIRRKPDRLRQLRRWFAHTRLVLGREDPSPRQLRLRLQDPGIWWQQRRRRRHILLGRGLQDTRLRCISPYPRRVEQRPLGRRLHARTRGRTHARRPWRSRGAYPRRGPQCAHARCLQRAYARGAAQRADPRWLGRRLGRRYRADAGAYDGAYARRERWVL